MTLPVIYRKPFALPRPVIAELLNKHDELVNRFTMDLFEDDPIPEVVKIKRFLYVRASPILPVSSGAAYVATYRLATVFEKKT